MTRRLLLATLLLLHLTVTVALTYSTQRPIPGLVFLGLARTGWALAVAAGLVLVAWALGTRLAQRLSWPTTYDPLRDDLLRALVGLAALGLTTLALGVIGWARPMVFRGLFAGGLVLTWRPLGEALRAGRPRAWRRAWQALPARGVAVVAAGLGLLLALAPPEGFDALLYHLRQPEWLLQHGRLQPATVYQFWHPGLVQGVYTWALALGSDRAAQVLSLAYAAAAALLAVTWSRDLFGQRTAALAWALMLSMPSLLVVAAGAYVDPALMAHTLAALYLAWRAATTEPALWPWAGVFVGLGMSTKYTALPLPIVVTGFAAGWPRPQWPHLRRAILVGSVAVLVALPWYARNARYMGNPFYPFGGGRAWNALRAQWLAEPGTGLGLQWDEWLVFPWAVTLGYRDDSYYHGRIGPLWLVLTPLALAATARLARRGPRWRAVWALWVGFAVVGGGLWTLGVARSRALWQARLLWPTLGALLPAFAYAARWSRALDLPGRLRVRYLVRWTVWGVVAITLLEWAVFVTARHPLAYALGLESRADYYRRALPDYQNMHDLLRQHTPPTARVVFFFEPRSYGLPRETWPDAILDHWPWFLQLYSSPAEVTQALTCQGWTHVLVYERGYRFLTRERADKWTPALNASWQTFLDDLTFVRRQGNYALYRLPPMNKYNCPPSAGPR